jgi:hypothetical protein
MRRGPAKAGRGQRRLQSAEVDSIAAIVTSLASSQVRIISSAPVVVGNVRVSPRDQ